MGLFDLIKKIPTPDEITGSMGEWMAKIFSKTVTDALVMHDVLIDGADDFTSQIDLILIASKGVFVVEVKLFNDAKIYGDVNKSKWYYYKHGHKYEIYSPVKQNSRHIEYLKEFLKDFGELPFFSVITMFCDDFRISGEFDGKTVLCNTLPAMDRGLKLLASKNPVVLSDEKRQEIFEFIKDRQIVGREARAEHKRDVIAYKNTVEEMKKQRICPYCKSELVLRNGKNGEFYGCKSFPKCRYTSNK